MDKLDEIKKLVAETEEQIAEAGHEPGIIWEMYGKLTYILAKEPEPIKKSKKKPKRKYKEQQCKCGAWFTPVNSRQKRCDDCRRRKNGEIPT